MATSLTAPRALWALLFIPFVWAVGTAHAGGGEDGSGGTAYTLAILAANGSPAAHARVTVRHAGGEMPARAADGFGRLLIEDLEPGDAAVLLVESADGSEKTLEPIFVVSEHDEHLTIRLYPPCRVQGQVLDAVGQPVAGAMARLSVLRWLGEADAGAAAHTDEAGHFEFHNLIPGAYYTVSAHAGRAEAPTATWRSRPFVVRGWDGIGHLEPLFPEGCDTAPPRPDGELLQRLLSGSEDEWFDAELRAWLPAVQTFDPNRVWGEPPEEAAWVWRAGRPDPVSEKLGAVVEFRREFMLDPARRKPAGYLTILADDYGLVRLNGGWVGVAAGYRQPVNLLIDPEHFRMGKNVLQVTLHNAPGVGRDEYNPTGFAYSLELIETAQ